MNRSSSLVCVLALLALLSSRSALAQSDPSAKAQAERLNDEGKALIKQLDLVGAAQRFRAALALSDDPRFAFNLCYTLEKSGQLLEAKTACEKVMASGDARLGHKANQLLASIEEGLAGGQGAPPPATQPVPTAPPPAATPTPPPAPPAEPAPTPEESRTKYGAIAGLSRANISSSVTTAPKLGFAIGVMLAAKLRSSFNTVLDLQLVQRGFVASEIDIAEVSATATYLDLGFSSRWDLGSGGFTPYLEAGTTLSLLLASSGEVDGMDVETDVQSFDFAYTLGIGGQVAMGARSFDVRARYVHGLINTADPDSVAIERATAYNRTILLQAGLWF